MRNQQVRIESEGLRGASEKLPIQKTESERTQRIREVIGVESVTAFGRRCGIGEATLRKYLGGAVPNTDNLVAIADAANVNIDWLAAGRGPKQRGAAYTIAPAPPQAPSSVNVDDLERLELAVESVEEGLAATHRTLPPSKYAQLIVAVYDLLADMEKKENVIKFIKLAV